MFHKTFFVGKIALKRNFIVEKLVIVHPISESFVDNQYAQLQ